MTGEDEQLQNNTNAAASAAPTLNRHARRAAEAHIRGELAFAENKENVAQLIEDAVACGLLPADRRTTFSEAAQQATAGVAYAALLSAVRGIACDKALAWLEAIHGSDGTVELSALDPVGTGGRVSVSGRLADEAQREQMVHFITEHFGRRNLYVGVNPRPAEFAGTSRVAKAGEIQARRFVVMDFDNKDAPGSDPEHASMIAKLRTLNPRAEVMSGNGTHLWFELAPGAPVEGSKFAISSAMKALHADTSMANADRIARLPWTINIPNASKRKRGVGLAWAKTVGDVERTAPVRSVDELVALWRGHGTAACQNEPASSQSAQAKASERVGEKRPSPAPSAELLRLALTHIPNQPGGSFDDHDDWTAFGHAVKGAAVAAGIESEGRNIWLEWCEQFGGDPDRDAEFWDTCRNPHTGWGMIMQTLKALNPSGYDVVEDAVRAHGLAALAAAPVDPVQAAQLAKIPTALAPGVPNWAAEVNLRYAYLESEDRILDINPDTGEVVAHLTPDRFKTRLGNQWVEARGKGTPLGQAWLTSPHRRQYTKLGHWPVGQEPKGALNLWRGFPASSGLLDDPDWRPLPASLPDTLAPTLEFISVVIADTTGNRGNRDHIAEYVLDWLAWKVQNPTNRPGTALALVGASGTGKSTLGTMVADLFGEQHSRSISKADQVLGRFNSSLDGAAVLCLEEAIFGGDPKIRGVYKDLITSPTINIERKGLDIGAPVRNMAAIIITSNEMSAIPHEPGERRTTFIKVSDVHRRDTAYFGKLRSNWTTGGREAVLDFLLKRDVSNFNPGQALSTPEKAEAAGESGDLVVQFWAETMDSGNLFNVLHRDGTAYDWEREVVFVPDQTLKRAFETFAQERGAPVRYEGGYRGLVRRLTELCPGMKFSQPRLDGPHKPGTRGHTFPVLDDCKKAFAVAMGGTG